MASGCLLEVIEESIIHEGTHYTPQHRYGVNRQLLTYRDAESLSYFMYGDDEPGR
jgi:hypothetical protein